MNPTLTRSFVYVEQTNQTSFLNLIFSPQAIKTHSGDEAVLTAATKCLTRLAVDATNATIIGEEGGVDAVVESMAAGVEVPVDSLTLIDKMCNHPRSLEKIVTEEMVCHIVKIMAHASTVDMCSRILEKMSRTKSGLEATAKAERNNDSTVSRSLVPVIYQTHSSGAVTNIAKVFTKMLSRDDKSETAASMRAAGAVDALLETLEKFPDDELMAKFVAKLLFKIMDGSVADLVAKMGKSLRLLSALAVDGEVSDEIVKAGGVGAIVTMFENQISARAKEELIRMIMRLATSGALDEILKSGVLAKLVALLDDDESDFFLKGLILQAFNKISDQARTVSHVANQRGALSALLATLDEHGKDSLVSHQALAFLGNLLREMSSSISAVDATKIILRAMRARPKDNLSQLHGTSALTFLVSGERSSDIEFLFEDIIAVALQNIDLEHHSLDLVRDSIKLLVAMGVPVPAAFLKCVVAVCARPTDTPLRKAVVDLVSILSRHDDTFVASKVRDVKVFADDIETVLSKGGSGNCLRAQNDLAVAAMSLGVIAMVPSNIPKLAAADAARPLVTLTQAVALARNQQSSDYLLPVFFGAILELLPSKNFPVEAALKAAVTVVKSYPDLLAAVVPALKLVDAIIKAHVADDVALKVGVVEACTKALMTVRYCDTTVLEPACSILHGLAVVRPQAVADRNGQKPCVAALEAAPAFFSFIAENEKDAPAIEASATRSLMNTLKTLEKVCLLGSEWARRVSALGAVNVIFDAMDARADDPDFVAQCERTLRLLVSDADALAALQKVRDVDLKAVSQGDGDIMRSANTYVSRLGLLMLCGFAELIRDHRGPETLATVLLAAVAATKDTKVKANLVRGCIEAIGRAAGRGLVVEGAIDLVPTVVKELRNNPSVDVVKAVAALVNGGDNALCEAFVEEGCVEALLPLLDNDALREPVFACLSALAKKSNEGAHRIVQGGALPFLCEYISEQLADGKGAVGQAVKLLAVLVEHGTSETILGAGALRVIGQILDALNQPRQPNTKGDEIEALCALMSGLATRHQGALTDSMVSGSAHKLMGLVKSLTDDESRDAVSGVIDLLDVLADDSGCARRLADAGAVDALIATMNGFPNDMPLAIQCARVLYKITGGAGGTLGPILAKIRELADAAADEDAMRSLVNMTKLAANLVLQPEIVADRADADDVAKTSRYVLYALHELPQSSTQHEAVSAALTLLCRLMNVEGVKIDDDLALDCLDDVLVGGDASIKATACVCLSSLCARGGHTSVLAVANRGLIPRVVQGSTGTFGSLEAEAATALRVMLDQVVPKVSQFVADPAGALALAQLLAGLPIDELEDEFRKIMSESEDGPQALLEVLAHMNALSDFRPGFELAATAIGRKLQVCATENPNCVVPCKTDHVIALCKARMCLLGCEDCLKIHASALDTPEGSALCFGTPLFGELVVQDLLTATAEDEEEDASASEGATRLVAKAVVHADPTANFGIVSAGVPQAMVSVLKKRRHNQPLVQNAFYALNALCDAVGVLSLGIGKDSIKAVADAMKAHPSSKYIQTIGKALLEKLRAAFMCGNAADELKERVRCLPGFHDATIDWQQIATSDDGAYFSNTATGMSSWEQPEVHLAFMEELDEIARLVDELEADMSALGGAAPASGIVNVLRTHSRDAGVVDRVARIFGAVGTHGPLEELADLEGLENLAVALDHCGKNEDLVMGVTDLLSRVTKVDKIKTKMTSKEFIRIINQTALNHMENGAVVDRCISTLANLAFNNPVVIGYEKELSVPLTLKWAMQRHLSDQKLCEMAVFSASCLLTDNDEQHKVYICDQLTPQIVEALKLYLSDPDFYTKVTRCMGSMSIADRCVQTMTSAGVVPLVVSGMDAHMNAPKVLRTAVELVSNFGAAEEKALDEEATRFLIQGGAIQGVRRVLDEHGQSQDLVASCFDALYNIANDESAARIIAELGLCELAVQCLDQYDFDRELRRQCVRMISILTCNDFSVERLANIGATSSLLDALSAHRDDDEFVVDCVLALSNLATIPTTGKVFLEKNAHLNHVFDLLTVYANDAEIVKFVLVTLVRLSTDDDLSRKVAEEGMPFVMRTATGSSAGSDDEVLSLIFELLGQLAFVKSNLQALVGAGGVKVLLDTLQVMEDSDPRLLVKTIATLDTLCRADFEYATVVLEAGGEVLIMACMDKWTGNNSIKQAGEAAISSIHAVAKQRNNRQGLLSRVGGASIDAGGVGRAGHYLEGEPLSDPLKKYRDGLTFGFECKEWTKGKGTLVKILVNEDFTYIYSITIKGTIQQTRLELKNLRLAKHGVGTGHEVKGLLKTRPSKDLCFVLLGMMGDDLFCGEARTKQEAVRIKEAFNTLFNVYSMWPHRLQRG